MYYVTAIFDLQKTRYQSNWPKFGHGYLVQLYFCLFMMFQVPDLVENFDEVSKDETATTPAVEAEATKEE